MADCGKKKEKGWPFLQLFVHVLEFALEIGIIDAILEGYSKHGFETQTVQKTW